jgi:hypothetical protein
MSHIYGWQIVYNCVRQYTRLNGILLLYDDTVLYTIHTV